MKLQNLLKNILTPLDLYLFGFSKNSVYTPCLHIIEVIEEAIRNKVGSITHENMSDNMERRINMYLQNNGQHTEHLL